MCGIAGYVGEGSGDLLAIMLAHLGHRGPDDVGVHVEREAGIGMTRLAIIDLATGRQPMANDDGSLHIVFNGEIYNYRELRPPLEARGYRFRTRSDTEVILRAYEEYGEACVERLRGMFAFAIWDGRRRALFVARDRLGKKPLFYRQGPRGFVFASEIKALFAHPAIGRGVDGSAFHAFLAYGYTPEARSIYAEIAKLPPAHTALYHEGALTIRRYWQLPSGRALNATRIDPGEAAVQVRTAVREAVRLRLESDVPLGVFLSGGIDSSAIVAAMRDVTSGRIATFSVGFGTAPSFDERPYARLVAQRFGTDHHEEVLEPVVTDILPAIVRHFDEPFADSSAIPTFAVAKATARHVKVALSGIGGDEAFGGYPRYLGVRLAQGYARLPRPLRAMAERVVGAVARDSDSSRNLADWARRFTRAGDVPMPASYLGWTRFFSEAALARLVTPGLAEFWKDDPDEPARAAFADHGHRDPVDGAFRIDLATYVPHDLLVMADRMSMAHSLELRAPFCDHVLLETSLGFPPALKIPRGRLKGLLKRAFADVLPREVLTHRKQGFMIPLGRWLRTDLRPLMEELLSPDRVRRRGLFAVAEVEALKHEHLSGARGHADRLWALMMTEAWMRDRLDAGGVWSVR
ncbi:MAG TPA: asparagine synthase (glutamine-hydrolyzing) [Methylomirabilota bacterium]|jgi:asparagine synthase (glutamine-hydrolysing)